MSCSSFLNLHQNNSSLPAVTQNAIDERCLFYESNSLTEEQITLQKIQKACRQAKENRVFNTLIQQLDINFEAHNQLWYQTFCRKISSSSKISDHQIIKGVAALAENSHKEELLALLLSPPRQCSADPFL